MWRKLFYSLLYFLSLLLTSALLNFVVLLFLNFDLFKVDIVKNKKQNGHKIDKLVLILKNNYLFFISTCIVQTLIDYFRSSLLERVINEFELGNWKVFIIIFSSFVTVGVIEIFPNYIASRESFKTLILNNLLLDFASLVTLVFSPLKFILKERKKFFTYNEEDCTRFINNLTSNEILLLEPSEARLVKSAFNINDKNITSVMIPIKETICLAFSMQTKEVIKFCLENNLSKYPVLSSSQEVVGVFNIKSLIFPLLRREKIVNWKLYINRKIIFLNYKTNLSTGLESLRRSHSHLAFVRNSKKIVGIVTLRDILGSLVGKIDDETV